MSPPIKNKKYASEVPFGFSCTLFLYSPSNQLRAAGLGFGDA